MLHKVYFLQKPLIVISCICLIIVIYYFFKKNKKGIISSLYTLGLLAVLTSATFIKIKSHNSKAEKFFGTYNLENYNQCIDCKILIKKDNQYLVFNQSDTLRRGRWELSISENDPDMIILDGKIFGIGNLKIKN